MFSVGALTMVLVAVAALAVYSTVMVLKLKDELKFTHKMIDDVYGTINHVSKEQTREMEKTYNDADRAFSDLKSHVDRRFDKTSTNVAEQISELHRIINDLNLNKSSKTNKQLING